MLKLMPIEQNYERYIDDPIIINDSIPRISDPKIIDDLFSRISDSIISTPPNTNNDPNSYSSEVRRLQMRAIDALLKAERQKKDYAVKQTDEALKSANRSSSANYMKYINPYGIQNENLSKAGLNYSGIAETNFAKGYNAYQNALSGAASKTQAAKDEINQSYLGAVAKANSDKLNVEADYYKNLNDNYWNKTTIDYYNGKLK